MPLCQKIILAVRGQFQVSEIFRGRTQARRDKDHALGVNIMNGFNGFFVDAVERGEIMVQLICGFIDEIEASLR